MNCLHNIMQTTLSQFSASALTYAAGPFALKVEFTDNVTIDGVKMYNIDNSGPIQNNLCNWAWKFYQDADLVGPQSDGYTGALLCPTLRQLANDRT